MHEPSVRLSARHSRLTSACTRRRAVSRRLRGWHPPRHRPAAADAQALERAQTSMEASWETTSLLDP